MSKDIYTNKPLQFLFKLMVFTFVMALMLFALGWVIPSKYFSELYPYLLAFYFAESMIINLVIRKNIEKRPAHFVNRFMIITGAKLLVSFTIMAFFAWFNKKDATSFIITFFILYMFYTPFQVVTSLRMLRKKMG